MSDDISATSLGKRKHEDEVEQEGEERQQETHTNTGHAPDAVVTKTARVESPASAGSPAPASGSGEDDEGKLREVLEKLKKLMGDDAKMPKALPVLMKAMEASLKPENAPLFLEVVQLAVTNKRMSTPKLRQSFLEVFLVMDKIKERFGAEHQFEVDTILLKRTHALLFTDDSYVLAKAAGVFQKVITALPQMKESKAVQSDPRLGHQRRQAVLDALETLMILANTQWAKPTVDVTMKLASEQRLQFPEEQREQLDNMTNKLKTIRNKSALGGGEKMRPSGFPSYSL